MWVACKIQEVKFPPEFIIYISYYFSIYNNFNIGNGLCECSVQGWPAQCPCKPAGWCERSAAFDASGCSCVDPWPARVNGRLCVWIRISRKRRVPFEAPVIYLVLTDHSRISVVHRAALRDDPEDCRSAKTRSRPSRCLGRTSPRGSQGVFLAPRCTCFTSAGFRPTRVLSDVGKGASRVTGAAARRRVPRICSGVGCRSAGRAPFPPRVLP